MQERYLGKVRDHWPLRRLSEGPVYQYSGTPDIECADKLEVEQVTGVFQNSESHLAGVYRTSQPRGAEEAARAGNVHGDERKIIGQRFGAVEDRNTRFGDLWACRTASVLFKIGNKFVVEIDLE